MLKLNIGSNTGSDTLTRPVQNRWPGDPWPGFMSALWSCAAVAKEYNLVRSIGGVAVRLGR